MDRRLLSDFTFYHVSNVCLGHVFGLEDLPEHGYLYHAAVLRVKHPAITWHQVRVPTVNMVLVSHCQAQQVHVCTGVAQH